MLKVVLDTNIFVSSLLVKTGLPAQILDAWRERQFILVTSPYIIAEIRATLSYPRIRRKYEITEEEIDKLITLLKQDGLLILSDTKAIDSIAKDPADEKVLTCAAEAKVDFIVSGDRHLLNLSIYQGIPILTVRQFIEHLQVPKLH
ncbi:MAG: putative toxin-antitoxin system toxin component, PIN family [Actinobacteria bacterium]|nr:putative toxin-antitoxin system toxin component, PIN family [Actinomycetota bacterium]